MLLFLLIDLVPVAERVSYWCFVVVFILVLIVLIVVVVYIPIVFVISLSLSLSSSSSLPLFPLSLHCWWACLPEKYDIKVTHVVFYTVNS